MKLNIFILVLTMILGFIITMLVQTGAPSNRSKIATAIPAAAPFQTAATNALPAFEMQDLKGKTYQSSDFAGKTIVINFWATWCPPCIVEFPRLLEIARAHPDDLVLLAISSDTNANSIERFLGRLTGQNAAAIKQDNVYIIHDKMNRITFDLFQTAMLPETIIVNSEQEMIHKLVGADWTLEDVAPYLPATEAASNPAP